MLRFIDPPILTSVILSFEFSGQVEIPTLEAVHVEQTASKGGAGGDNQECGLAGWVASLVIVVQTSRWAWNFAKDGARIWVTLLTGNVIWVLRGDPLRGHWPARALHERIRYACTEAKKGPIREMW